MFGFGTITIAVLAALLIAALTFIVHCKWTFTYWKKRNLMCVEDPTLPFGNALLVWKEKFAFATVVKRLYELAKQKGYAHAGGYVFTMPIYIVVGPDKIKSVLQQNFDHFPERLYADGKADDPFLANLAFAGGERWKHLRSQITPGFTSTKIKMLVDSMVRCAHQMQKDLARGNTAAVDVKQMSLCYLADVIGVCAYGLDCNSFNDPDSELITHAKNFIDFTSTYRLMKVGFKLTLPTLAEWLGVFIFDGAGRDFFLNLAKETAKFRKQNDVVRKDFFRMLLDAETELNVEEMDDEASNSAKIIKEVASQVFLFFAAGFETSALTLTFCLFELSQNSTIQDKIRAEIDAVLAKYKGEITYDAVMEMKYVSQVVDETLRKYPSITFITRRCAKDCKIGDATIGKGVMAFISILGLHHDPEHYHDPEKFDPERFSDENKQNMAPFTYLPFGEGPRICPALRFALMQIKVGLITLLQQYTLSLNNKTTLPIEMDPRRFTMMPKSGIFLDLKLRHT